MKRIGLIWVASLTLAACGQSQNTGQPQGGTEAVATASAVAQEHPGEWRKLGGGSDEQHFSPLTQINDQNVTGLRPAWVFELDTRRGQEGQPLVVDGVLYISTAWSKVYALEAGTGKELWKYDPKVPGVAGPRGCCDVVSRGVAYEDGRIFVATFDGRLAALDARTGKEIWIVNTVDQSQSYTITGAPRVAKGKVFIGNAGAEFGVRGYVTAYDVATGKQAWRFYTVPGEPGVRDGQVSDAVLEKLARPTWFGDTYWKQGGGGTAWDAIVYDRELDQLYIGVGNGSPHSHHLRSEGRGDNLFLASVVAVDPDTGEYRWHYQETPGDSWDYTSVQPMILADIGIDGEKRKVILHAPKNGFFYVIDRTTGTPVSARPFVDDIRWAKGIDPKTWRPIDVEGSRYAHAPFLNSPHVAGAHNWTPMAFSPLTGLVYIPTSKNYFQFAATAVPHSGEAGSQFAPNPNAPKPDNYLQALDPITGKQRWRVDANGWKPDAGGGGVLATAGNLVFQGRGDILGEMLAIAADTGKVLWRQATPNAVMAAPVTYVVDGEQYVAVSTGGGGGGSPMIGSVNPPREQQPGRVIAFKLGGTAKLPDPPPLAGPATDPKEVFAPALVAQGGGLYAGNCGMCHGMPGMQSNVIKDLRRSPLVGDAQAWRNVVHEGAYEALGMRSFKGILTPQQVDAIRAYMGSESQRLAANQRKGLPER